MTEVPWWRSGLRIWHCHSCSLECCFGAGLIPGPRTSACHQCSQKKKKKKKKKTPKTYGRYMFNFLKNCHIFVFQNGCTIYFTPPPAAYERSSFYTSSPIFMSDIYLFILIFFFFWSFQGCTHSIWSFPGEGSNWSCSHRPAPQPQQCQIQASSVTYTTALGNARSLTC